MGRATLIVVIGFTIIFGKTFNSLNERTLTLIESATEQYERTIARNLAISGLNIAISELSRDPDWRYGLNNTAFYGGEYLVTAVDVDSMVRLTSTGINGNTNKVIQVDADFLPPILLPVNNFALFADFDVFAYDDVIFSSGSGTITGDIYANGNVDIGGDHTFNGTISQGSPPVEPPTIDWNFFKDEALAVGQYVTDDKTFTSSGSPYTGVWYVENTAYIEDNVVINGTLVVENDLKFQGDYITLTATPSDYPALLAGDSVTEGDNIHITGFIYCGNDWDMNGDNLTVIGQIIARNSIKGSGSNKVIIYDSNTQNVVETVFESSSSSESSPPEMRILSWREF